LGDDHFKATLLEMLHGTGIGLQRESHQKKSFKQREEVSSSEKTG